MRAVELGEELVEGARGSVVATALQTAEKPVPLGIDVGGRQLGLQGEFGGELEQLAPETSEGGSPDLRVVGLAVGVHLAAQSGDGVGDLASATLGGALDDHGLQEVR